MEKKEKRGGRKGEEAKTATTTKKGKKRKYHANRVSMPHATAHDLTYIACATPSPPPTPSAVPAFNLQNPRHCKVVEEKKKSKHGNPTGFIKAARDEII